jgi:hypothetical protein
MIAREVEPHGENQNTTNAQKAAQKVIRDRTH